MSIPRTIAHWIACRDRARGTDWGARLLRWSSRKPGMIRCSECGESVDPEFARQSGDLCGYCLAGYGVPLTRIAEPPPGPRLPNPGTYEERDRR